MLLKLGTVLDFRTSKRNVVINNPLNTGMLNFHTFDGEDNEYTFDMGLIYYQKKYDSLDLPEDFTLEEYQELEEFIKKNEE